MVTPVKKRSFIRAFFSVYFMALVLGVVGTIVGYFLLSIVSAGISASFLPSSYWLTWFGICTVIVSLLTLLGWVVLRQWRDRARSDLDYACLSGVIFGTLLAMLSSLNLTVDQQHTSVFFIWVGGIAMVGTILAFFFGDKLPD